MKLLIVHLSDIHLAKSSQYVIGRAECIVAAAQTVEVNPDKILLVISGDIAARGKAEEYGLASSFIEALQSKFREAIGEAVEVQTICVAGNHDIDFEELGPETVVALSNDVVNSQKQVSTSEGIFKTLLRGQEAYSIFESTVTGVKPESTKDRIYKRHECKLGDKSISVSCFNTAVLSRLQDTQGKLWFPMELVDGEGKEVKANDYSISIFHHPDRWLESNNSVAFGQYINATSDLVLNGHQHTPDSSYAESLSGNMTWYSAGGALQDASGVSSEFTCIALDFSENKRRLAQFSWNGTVYPKKLDTEWCDFGVNASARGGCVLTEAFRETLQDPGNLIIHSQKKTVSLNDIYEPCRLKVRQSTLDENQSTFSANDIPQYLVENPRIMILGDAQSGKGVLAKETFRRLLKSNGSIVPVLLSGKTLKSGKEQDLVRWIKRTYEEQYNTPTFESFWSAPKENRIAIVDEWQDLQLNASGKLHVGGWLGTHFSCVVLIADSWYQLEELSHVADADIAAFIDSSLHILPYSPVQRTNMIQRWIMLGREDVLDQADAIYEIDTAERYLDELTNSGILPRFPLHILSALQIFQAIRQTEPDLGAQGELYDALVSRALKAMSDDAPEMDINRQFIAMIAGAIFQSDQQELSTARINELVEEYWRDYAIRIDIGPLLELLVVFRVLRSTAGNYSFRERYVYYYFVAEFYTARLAKRSLAETTLKELKGMAEYLSYEEYAQVLMFVIYKTRNIELIDEVIINSQLIFEGTAKSDLSDDVAFVNQLSPSVHPMALTAGEVEESRKARRHEMRDSDLEATVKSPKMRYSVDLDDAAKLQHAFKAMQMMGRILRNFPGTLETATKRQLASSTIELGLRTLKCMFIGIEGELEDVRARFREAVVEKSDGKFDPSKIEKRADALLTILITAASFITIHTVAKSVGSSKLTEIYKMAYQDVGSMVSTELVDVSVQLEYFRDLPLDQLYKLEEKLRDNFVAYQILRIIVWRRLIYLPLASRALRQQICQRFSIQSSAAPILLANS